MGLLAEGFEIEIAMAAPKLAAQRREAGGIDPLPAKHEAVGAFFQLEPVAGLHAHRF